MFGNFSVLEGTVLETEIHEAHINRGYKGNNMESAIPCSPEIKKNWKGQKLCRSIEIHGGKLFLIATFQRSESLNFLVFLGSPIVRGVQKMSMIFLSSPTLL